MGQALSIDEQHIFIDEAKDCKWAAVKEKVTSNRRYANVHPEQFGRMAGWSALHHAAKNGEESVIKFLLENGADLKAKTADGRTALQIAEENSVMLSLTETPWWAFMAKEKAEEERMAVVAEAAEAQAARKNGWPWWR